MTKLRWNKNLCHNATNKFIFNMKLFTESGNLCTWADCLVRSHYRTKIYNKNVKRHFMVNIASQYETLNFMIKYIYLFTEGIVYIARLWIKEVIFVSHNTIFYHFCVQVFSNHLSERTNKLVRMEQKSNVTLTFNMCVPIYRIIFTIKTN